MYPWQNALVCKKQEIELGLQNKRTTNRQILRKWQYKSLLYIVRKIVIISFQPTFISFSQLHLERLAIPPHWLVKSWPMLWQTIFKFFFTVSPETSSLFSRRLSNGSREMICGQRLIPGWTECKERRARDFEQCSRRTAVSKAWYALLEGTQRFNRLKVVVLKAICCRIG